MHERIQTPQRDKRGMVLIRKDMGPSREKSSSEQIQFRFEQTKK